MSGKSQRLEPSGLKTNKKIIPRPRREDLEKKLSENWIEKDGIGRKFICFLYLGF